MKTLRVQTTDEARKEYATARYDLSLMQAFCKTQDSLMSTWLNSNSRDYTVLNSWQSEQFMLNHQSYTQVHTGVPHSNQMHQICINF